MDNLKTLIQVLLSEAEIVLNGEIQKVFIDPNEPVAGARINLIILFGAKKYSPMTRARSLEVYIVWDNIMGKWILAHRS